MANVHVEPGPPGSPTLDQIIADTEGRRADRRPRQLLDRPAALQRPVRRERLLGESRTARRRAWCTDVTYNAITTDFWGNLDAITGPEQWEMHGTGGDAKGQPTQTNSISHGSPYLRIKKILVGPRLREGWKPKAGSGSPRL
jgi:TldD protein